MGNRWSDLPVPAWNKAVHHGLYWSGNKKKMVLILGEIASTADYFLFRETRTYHGPKSENRIPIMRVMSRSTLRTICTQIWVSREDFLSAYEGM
jgi:hypothetical protein